MVSIQYVPSSYIDYQDEVLDGISHAIEIIEVIIFTTIDFFVLNVFGQEIEGNFDILGVWSEVLDGTIKRNRIERTTP